MLSNHYHVHLTINNNFNLVIPKSFKQTTIILENNNNQQKDVMLTKHYVLGYKNINTINDIKFDIQKTIKDYNLEVIRIKLEKDICQQTDIDFEITKQQYLEIHCKISNTINTKILQEHNFVRSRNPNSKNVNGLYYFWNKRVYTQDDNFSNIAYIKNFLNDIEYEELKIEQIIFDTNHNIDSWWA